MENDDYISPEPIRSQNVRISQGWVKCSDRLPDMPYRSYLVYMKEFGITICKWLGKDNPDRPYEYHGWKLPYEFSHWMPLPMPPE
jgi:hypothetical protein